MTKIMIITMYCGETDYDACKASVKSQDYSGFIDHIFIENLPNIMAHKQCYKTIMDHANDYDLFIKLDADMVLLRTTALSELVEFWAHHNHPDHMVFAVQDYISNQNIIGIHVFSKHCRWIVDRHDGLFVDPNPLYNGTYIKTYTTPAPFASHAQNPSDHDAFHFGLHRALKAFQWGKFPANVQAYGALKSLINTAQYYKQTGRIQAKLALMGAETVRTRTLPKNSDYKQIPIINDLSINFWLSPIRVKLYWGIKVAPRILPHYLRQKIKGLFN